MRLASCAWDSAFDTASVTAVTVPIAGGVVTDAGLVISTAVGVTAEVVSVVLVINAVGVIVKVLSSREAVEVVGATADRDGPDGLHGVWCWC